VDSLHFVGRKYKIIKNLQIHKILHSFFLFPIIKNLNKKI